MVCWVSIFPCVDIVDIVEVVLLALDLVLVLPLVLSKKGWLRNAFFLFLTFTFLYVGIHLAYFWAVASTIVASNGTPSKQNNIQMGVVIQPCSFPYFLYNSIINPI